MKPNLLSIIILLLIFSDVFGQRGQEEPGNFIEENIPEIPTDIRNRVVQYLNSREAQLEGWLPNNQGMLIKTRFGETNQLHLASKPGGSRRQLTFFEDYVHHAYACPDPARNGFLFTKDLQRNEHFQIYFFDLLTGNYQLLSDGESPNNHPVWAPDGKRFAYEREVNEGREIVLYDFSHQRDTVIRRAEGLWVIGDWMDANHLLVMSEKEGELYLFNVDNGITTPVDSKNLGGPPLPAADGSGFYFPEIVDRYNERITYYDLKEKTKVAVSPDIPWEIEHYARSKDGRYLSYVVNEDGYSTLYIHNLLTRETKKIDQLSRGVILNIMFSPDSKSLGLVFSTSTSPPDIYTLDLGSHSVTRWTFSEIGGLQEAQLVEPELIHYPTFDSINGVPRMISAWVYLPKGEGPFPVLVSLHGGPASQSRPDFSMDTRIIQYQVNELGIAVIQPNVRGSSGYGFDFRNLDNGMLRENAVKDVGALLQWIRKNEKLDPSRVAVDGGSYGGYLALSTMIHYSDQLKAGIDMWGMSNFISFADYIAKNRDAGNLAYQRREYGDERDPEVKSFLEAISPVNHLDKIKAPVLVMHGVNDFRVPLSQSEEVIATFRNNGQTYWYLVARDDGHGFQKKSNTEYAVQVMALFLKTYLLEEAH